MNPPTSQPTRSPWIFFLGIVLLVYILTALTIAGYILWQAKFPPAGQAAIDVEIQKLAVPAAVGLIGVALTAIGAVYAAYRQHVTAVSLAIYNKTVSENLQTMKAASDEALAKLQVALDAEHVAHRELFGAASAYFYTLRSITFARWDEEELRAAEASMIAATRHLIHVRKEMRDAWFNFWQRAQEIYRDARAQPDKGKRPDIIKTLIATPIAAPSTTDFRELFDTLATTATKTPQGGGS